MIGKYILPWFGGSPAVWMTCLMFFQLVLLGGYAYAHYLQELRSRKQIVIHSVLLAFAVLAGLALLPKWGSPILPPVSLRPTGSEAPTWQVFKLLLISIGFPYFLLSTSASLLQAWFHKVDRSQSPYVFYVVSNVASLLALLTYPALVEPNLTVKTQSLVWGGAFVAYAGLCLWCVFKVWKSHQPEECTKKVKTKDVDTSSRPLLWILLSFCGVLALMAITNQMTQNIPPVPFLWILPLSLYLLSFIVGFAEKQRGWQVYYIFLVVCALALVTYLSREGLEVEIKKQVAGYGFILLAICLFCHNALYRAKPDPHRLTGFYLCISLGGALGGLFVVLAAPFLFKGYWEYQLCLILSGGLAIWVTYSETTTRDIFGKLRHIFPLLLVGYAVFLGKGIVKETRGSVYMGRNFFGSVRVVMEISQGIPIYSLMHGKINHGMQIQHEKLRYCPITYFSVNSGVGLAFQFKRKSGPFDVGVVGLGIGTLAAYGREGDSFRMYEIDPDVVRLARETQWFTYLSDCKADVTVVEGDGRLCLENEMNQKGSHQFDVLVLDAFTGDSPPAHLLTLEAFDLYLNHMEENGVLAVNISNRYLDLLPVLDRVRETYGLQMAYIHSRGDGGKTADAQWILLSRNSSFLQYPKIAQADIYKRMSIKKIRPWTDEFSNLLSVIK